MPALELLSPAKDLECGLAAINCGAEAVYLGAACFSNLLLHDDEINEAVKFITGYPEEIFFL